MLTVIHQTTAGDTYVVRFTIEARLDAQRLLGQWATDPHCSFTWCDAAVLSREIRSLVDYHLAQQEESP